MIHRALEDACGQGLHGDAMRRARDQDEAIAWLTSMGRDFLDVCRLADFDAEVVRRHAFGLLRQPPLRIE